MSDWLIKVRELDGSDDNPIARYKATVWRDGGGASRLYAFTARRARRKAERWARRRDRHLLANASNIGKFTYRNEAGEQG